MNDPSPQVVLVTGAGGHGVGAGVCDALSEAGLRLVLNDIDAVAVGEAADRYPGALAVPGDLRTAEGSAQVVRSAIAQYGRIDAIINNAGVGLARPAHLSDEADFDRVFTLNVRSMWLVSRAFVRHRIDHGGGGAIVNVSSVHAQHTQNGYAIYAASKGAVEGLTRGMATELGIHGIRCNAVAPGAVLDVRIADRYGVGDDPIEWIGRHSSEQQVIDRPVTPIDVGRVVSFLVSPEAWAIAGQTVTVDAGLSTLLYDRAFTGDVSSG